MRNFLESSESTEKSIKELSYHIYRIEAHIYRGELGQASALLAGVENDTRRLREDINFPLGTILVGSQLGFLSGGAFRGRIPGAIIGGVLGWLYGQHLATHTRLDLDIIESRIDELHMLLRIQARRIADGATTAGPVTSGLGK